MPYYNIGTYMENVKGVEQLFQTHKNGAGNVKQKWE